MTALLVSLALFTTFPDTTQALYAAKDVASLQRVCAAPTTPEADLLCRYRLYPLTQDERYLDGLPADLEEGSARSLALLAGLWGYRTARAPFHLVPRYGMRAERLMKKARALAPDDVFVLLVDGQSLLFKPAIAGGDARAALARFRLLRRVAAQQPHGGVSPLEADLWTWYTLRKLGDPAADPMRTRLLAAGPPRLYREFLLSPP